MCRLVLVVGVPGSGKTKLSRLLVARLSASYLCSDTITDMLCASDRASPDYVELRPRIYATMYALAEENLLLGGTVLIDAPHLPTTIGGEWGDAMQALTARAGARLRIVRLACSEKERRARLERRRLDRDEDKLTHWDEHVADCPTLYDLPLDHVDLGSEEPIEEQLTSALAYIRAP